MALPKQLYTKKDGAIRESKDFNIMVGGSIEKAGFVYEKQNGQWKEVWASHLYTPSGTIIMFDGSIEDIPLGWVMCDGQNGTPDLRERFIVGAGGDYSVGDTGGAKTVTLSIDQMPVHSHAGNVSVDTHSHTYQSGYTGSGPEKFYKGNSTGDYSGINSDYDGAHGHSSPTETQESTGGQAHNNMPAYCALLFIMKL